MAISMTQVDKVDFTIDTTPLRHFDVSCTYHWGMIATSRSDARFSFQNDNIMFSYGSPMGDASDFVLIKLVGDAIVCDRIGKAKTYATLEEFKKAEPGTHAAITQALEAAMLSAKQNPLNTVQTQILRKYNARLNERELN